MCICILISITIVVLTVISSDGSIVHDSYSGSIPMPSSPEKFWKHQQCEVTASTHMNQTDVSWLFLKPMIIKLNVTIEGCISINNNDNR